MTRGGAEPGTAASEARLAPGRLATGAENAHGVALVVGEAGALILGPPGAGKTALALETVERARARGLFARLVADDRVLLERRGGRLLARPHPLLAGLVEERGLGVGRRRHEPACVVRLLVALDGSVEASSREGPGRPAEAVPERLGAAAAEPPRLVLPRGIGLARAARLLLARLVQPEEEG